VIKTKRKIKVGVVGLRRGMSFANLAAKTGMELVALCDIWEEKIRELRKVLKVPIYTSYHKFLEHDMDAVVLANYFHQHAPFAIKALNSGRHVLSEVIVCKTLGEGVALVRAFERSKKIYMLAENYVYMAYIQEMQRLYKKGEIGEMQLGECEYMHPCSAETLNKLAPGINHWRNYIPSTYYPTHALGPIMFITNTMPMSVNAQSIPFSKKDKQNLHIRRGDQASAIICRMNNGAVVTINGPLLRGHGNWYRIHGTRGLMENCRTSDDQDKLRIVHEEWDLKPGDIKEKIYRPDFPIMKDLARSSGHGGGDFFIAHHFAEAIRKNKQPWLNIYRGIAMSIVGIQAWRSCLADGAPFEISDLSKGKVRKKYEKDNWSPFPEDKGPGQPFSSIRGKIIPSAKQIAFARKVWKKMGYKKF